MCDKLNCAVIPPSCGGIGEQAFGYSCDENKISVRTDMMMIGAKYSEAERYAAENELGFAEKKEAAEAFAPMMDIEKKKASPEWAGYAGAGIFAALIIIVGVAFFNEIRGKKLK